MCAIIANNATIGLTSSHYYFYYFSASYAYWGCCRRQYLPPLWYINWYSWWQRALGFMVSGRPRHSNLQVSALLNSEFIQKWWTEFSLGTSRFNWYSASAFLQIWWLPHCGINSTYDTRKVEIKNKGISQSNSRELFNYKWIVTRYFMPMSSLVKHFQEKL